MPPAAILLVEDEPGIQLAIRGLLRRDGHEIEVASTAGEALAALSRRSFELVLTDLSLPDGLSGLDLLERVRREHDGTPVVLITAYGSEQVARDAVRGGAFDYVPKPFNNDEIRNVVRRALAGRRAGEGAPTWT